MGEPLILCSAAVAYRVLRSNDLLWVFLGALLSEETIIEMSRFRDVDQGSQRVSTPVLVARIFEPIRRQEERS